MALDDENEGTEEQATEKKSSKKLVLICAAAFAFLVVAIGVPAAYFLVFKKEAPVVEELEADAAQGEPTTVEGFEEELEFEEDEEALGAIIPFDTFLVNLSGGKYIRVQLQVEFETLEVPRRFYTRLVPIRDGVISLLTQQSAEELLTSRGREKLRTAIRQSMNDTLRKEHVKRVYFTQFVIQ